MTRITVSDYARTYLRDRVQGHMNCTIELLRHRDSSLDETTGLYTAVSKTSVYSGVARIWEASSGSIVEVGEADLALVSTYCSIPFDVDVMPHRDDQVLVTACPGDPDLVGRGYRVLMIDGGGLMRATRKMQLIAQAENRAWRPEGGEP